MKRLIFKVGRRIVCYIEKDAAGWHLSTGKPSDRTCWGTSFDDWDEAITAANALIMRIYGQNVVIRAQYII